MQGLDAGAEDLGHDRAAVDAEPEHRSRQRREPSPAEPGKELGRREIDDIEQHDDRQAAADLDVADRQAARQRGARRPHQRENEPDGYRHDEGQRGDQQGGEGEVEQLGQPAMNVLGVDLRELEHRPRSYCQARFARSRRAAKRAMGMVMQR